LSFDEGADRDPWVRREVISGTVVALSAVFTVSAGTLTMYEGDDPSCTPQLFPAGTGSIEADSPAHNHLLRNETNSVAQTIVTFIVPVGASLRTDLPDPGNCPF
jgi:hypothetical protein